MASDLEIGLLRAFAAAARAGSISRAATALGQTQPGLSQQVRRLEQAVGQPLLERTPTGVSLTPAGARLLPYAERILALSTQALAAAHQTLSGHCGVGVIEDLATERLPAALTDFGRLHPGATIELITASSAGMRRAFEAGRLHVALCDTSHPPAPPDWSVRTPLVWTIGPGTDPAADPLPLVLLSQPCPWRAPLLESLDAAGRPWRVVFESTSLAAVRAAARAGLGVAALLPAALDAGLTAVAPGTLPPIPDVSIGVVRRPGTQDDPLVDAVAAVLRALL